MRRLRLLVAFLGNAIVAQEVDTAAEGGAGPAAEALVSSQPWEHAPAYHVCCYYAFDGPVQMFGDASAFGTLPEPTNHSSTFSVACSAPVSGGGIQCEYCKERAVCDFCSCLHANGRLDSWCCSLNQWREAGVDPATGYPYCGSVNIVHNTRSRETMDCPLNYDVYDWESTAGPVSLMPIGWLRTFLVVLGVILIVVGAVVACCWLSTLVQPVKYVVTPE
mmetsp:Transcript_872/g.1743  ORF Transcript_872/g.1743 Transcript_872/m.1743 type:complete len:220 (-) Transcript_872:9-668(-)